MKVCTRIAPSPTGSPHIGTAYVALFNYAFARSRGGRFLLRIEDTDRARSSAAFERDILDALHWLGLSWDEGPDTGGPHAPYRQSERGDIYRQHAATLVERGGAYPCFCAAERLAELRREQTAAKQSFVGYDRRCAALSPDESRARVAAGEPHVIRLHVPTEGECVFDDLLRGEVRIGWQTVDDQVLLKSDGFPTYHLAAVVDDRLMGITHVIRGEDWLSSTPKHIRLYEAFGWEPPRFAHLPLLRNPDQTKLSKRRNPTSILYYRQAGILPEALLNFLGLTAYSLPDDREDFTLEELVASFDLGRVSLGGPVFDLQKLAHFNGRYLRRLDTEALLQRCKAWMLNDDTWRRVLALAQPRLERLTDLVPMAAFLFADRLDYDPALLLERAPTPEAAPRLLRIAQWEIERAPWEAEALQALFGRIAEMEQLKLKRLMPLFFVAFTGSAVSLPIFDSLLLMGRDMCLRRLHYALAALEAAGAALKGKALKAFTRDYQNRYGAAPG